MVKRILGYEIYTREAENGQPLFMVTELCEGTGLSIVFQSQSWDMADACLRHLKKEKKKSKETCCVYHFGGGTYGECGGPAHLDY